MPTRSPPGRARALPRGQHITLARRHGPQPASTAGSVCPVAPSPTTPHLLRPALAPAAAAAADTASGSMPSPSASPAQASQALVRPLVQVLVLTPMSVLGSVVSVLCGALLVRPSADVRLARHWTYLSPSGGGIIGLGVSLLATALFFSVFALATAGSARAGRAREEVARAIGLLPALGYASVGAAALAWSLGVAGPNHASKQVLTFAAAVSWASAVLLFVGVARTYFLHARSGSGAAIHAPLRPSFARHPIEWACVHLPPRVLLAVHAHALAPALTLIASGHDALSGNKALEAGTGLADALALGPAILAGLWVFATQDVAYATAATTIYINILKSRYDPDKARSINGRPIPPFDPGYPPPVVDVSDVRRAPLEAERPPSVSFALIGAVIIILTCIAASFVGGDLARGTCGPSRTAQPIQPAPAPAPGSHTHTVVVHEGTDESCVGVGGGGGGDPERQPLLSTAQTRSGSPPSTAPRHGAVDDDAGSSRNADAHANASASASADGKPAAGDPVLSP